MDYLAVAGNHVLDLGSGNDRARYGSREVFILTDAFGIPPTVTYSVGVQISGKFTVNLGAGNDTLETFVLTVGSRTVVSAGKGDDSIRFDRSDSKHLVIVAGAGNDRVLLESSQFERLNVLLGDGDDEVIVGGVTVAETAVFAGQAGNDAYFDESGKDYLDGLDTYGPNSFGRLFQFSFETIGTMPRDIFIGPFVIIKQ